MLLSKGLRQTQKSKSIKICFNCKLQDSLQYYCRPSNFAEKFCKRGVLCTYFRSEDRKLISSSIFQIWLCLYTNNCIKAYNSTFVHTQERVLGQRVSEQSLSSGHFEKEVSKRAAQSKATLTWSDK